VNRIEGDRIDETIEQLGRLLELLAARAPAPLPTWTPRAARFESETETVIQLEIPGVARDAVAVSVLEGVVQVTGTRPAPHAGEGRVIAHASEIPVGRFARAFQLSVTTSAEVTARLRDGMLELRAPRTPVAHGTGNGSAKVPVR
jgi:HSP20 family protein